MGMPPRDRELERLSSLTDAQLADLLPTLPPFRRVEVVIAKYANASVYNGERTAPEAQAMLAHLLVRKIAKWIPLERSASRGNE